MLKLLFVAAILAFIGWSFVQHFRNRPAPGPRERFFNIRAWAFSGLLTFVFLLAFMVVPNKGRVLLMAPIFLAGMSITKWMQKTRARLRHEEAERSNFERAKRIN